MKKTMATAAALLTMAVPAFAEGDAAAGEKEFRKCKSCHSIVAEDGTAIVKGGKTGPNLYGVVGRVFGSTDFKYSSLLEAAMEQGLIWDGEGIASFIADPNAYMSEITGESGRSKMAKQNVKNAEDIVAYLESVAPAAE
jgi:cytochrome c